ncbi:hypothetical protein BgiBS90_015237 [Biomphalaria glabrata]|nr:hypothetical protein BgiBS90_015237 [Biomphalaria glabrata]
MEEMSESQSATHTENINLEKTKEILTHNDNTAAEILTSHEKKDAEDVESAKMEAQSITSRTHSETRSSEDEGPPASGEQLDLNNPPQDKDEIKEDPLDEKSLDENTNLDQSRINEIHESEDPVSSESMVLKSQKENLAETAEEEGEMTDYCVVTAEEVMEDEKNFHVTESTGASLETLHSFGPELGRASLDETQLHNLLNRDDVKVEYSQQERIDLLCDNVQKDTIEATEVSSESINISQPSSNETFSDNDATSKLETTDACNDKSDFSKLEPTDALNETTDATKGDSDSLKDNSNTAEQETDTIYKHNDDTVQQETGVYLNYGGISHLQTSDISPQSTSCTETSKISLSHDNFIDHTNLETGNMSSDNALNASLDKSDIIFGTSKPIISDNIGSIAEHSLNSPDVCLHEEKCSAENRDTVSSSTETEAQLKDISLVPNEEQVLDDSLNSSAQGTDPMLHNTELSAAGIDVDPVSEATETSTKLECLSETKETAENFKVATSVLPQDKGQSTPPLGFSNESPEFPESASETNLTPDIGTEVAADEPPLDETINRNISENIINKGESIVTSEDTKNKHSTTAISKEEEGGGPDHFHSLDQDVASGDVAALPVSNDGVILPTKDNIEQEQHSHLYESLDQEAGLEDAAMPKSCSELNSANVEHKDDHFQPLDEDTGNLMPKSFHLIAEPQSKETPDSCATNSEGTINESANTDEDSFGKVPAEQQDFMRNTDIKADHKAGCSGMSLTRAFLQFGVVTLFGVGSAAVAPIALAAAGFEASGIAAGSVAEYLMTLTSSAGFGMSFVTLLEDAGTDSLGVIPQVFFGFLSAAAAGGFVLTSGLFRSKKQSASVSNDVTAAKERKTDLSTSTVSKDDQSDERVNSDNHIDQHENIIKKEEIPNKEIETSSSSTVNKNIDESLTKASNENEAPIS